MDQAQSRALVSLKDCHVRGRSKLKRREYPMKRCCDLAGRQHTRIKDEAIRAAR
jgi:hypothetical protein